MYPHFFSSDGCPICGSPVVTTVNVMIRLQSREVMALFEVANGFKVVGR